MRTLLILFAIVLSTNSFAQHEFATATSRFASEHEISNLDRYGYDYYLPGYVFNGDSSILEAIDLDRLEVYREVDNTVTFEDKITGLTITLIAINRIGRDDHDEINPDHE